MTYNDGDTAFVGDVLTNQRVEIINAYSPDIIGMQEVQDSQLETYKNKLSGYDYVSASYGEYDYSLAVYYNTSKLKVINSGTVQLNSRVGGASTCDDGAAYLRVFGYVVFESIRSGNRFVFVNTHLDYNAGATEKQVKKLLELTASDASINQYPIIYTADWNDTNTSTALQQMNAAGYVSTAGNDKTTTTVDGVMIDFIYIDQDVMNCLAYKVVNDHRYSATASDHYAVYSDITING